MRLIAFATPVLALIIVVGAYDLMTPRQSGATIIDSTRMPSLPPPGYRLVLDDDFKSLSLWNGSAGTWEPGFWHGGRYDSTSGELEYYVDPRRGRDTILVQAQSPFELTNRGLQIVARPIQNQLRRLIANQTYTSGFISTQHSVSLAYGYIEIRAKIPKGSGLWPAFWMLPEDETWPPEIDILEAIGGEGPQYWATVHFGPLDPEGREMYKVSAPSLRDTFHDIGLLWTPDRIVWTFDGRKVAQTSTPENLKSKRMYLILCMAVGGKWAKPPEDPTIFPAKLEIERVRMYSPPNAATQ